MIEKRKDILDIKSNNYQATILHIAAARGLIHLMKFILSNGYIDVDVKDRNARTPLYYATSRNQTEARELLIEYNGKM